MRFWDEFKTRRIFKRLDLLEILTWLGGDSMLPGGEPVEIETFLVHRLSMAHLALLKRLKHPFFEAMQCALRGQPVKYYSTWTLDEVAVLLWLFTRDLAEAEAALAVSRLRLEVTAANEIFGEIPASIRAALFQNIVDQLPALAAAIKQRLVKLGFSQAADVSISTD